MISERIFALILQITKPSTLYRSQLTWSPPNIAMRIKQFWFQAFNII